MQLNIDYFDVTDIFGVKIDSLASSANHLSKNKIVRTMAQQLGLEISGFSSLIELDGPDHARIAFLKMFVPELKDWHIILCSHEQAFATVCWIRTESQIAKNDFSVTFLNGTDAIMGFANPPDAVMTRMCMP